MSPPSGAPKPSAADGTVARLLLTGDVTLGPESELHLIKVDAAPFGPQTDHVGVIGTLGSIARQFSSITVFKRDCSAGCVDREIPGVTAAATYRSNDVASIIDITVTAAE